MKVASVILDIPTQALDSAYTYAVSDECSDVEVGCAVVVPFGGRQAIGYVIELNSYDEDEFAKNTSLDPAKIKPIIQVLSSSYFDDNAAACAAFLSKAYIAPLSTCVKLFTPPGGVPRMVRSGRTWRVEEPNIGPIDDRWVHLTEEATSYTPKANATKQIRVIEALLAGELRVAELSLEFGNIHVVLKTLEEKGVVAIETRRKIRGVRPSDEQGLSNHHFERAKTPPVLTNEQTTALQAISQAQDAGNGQVVVLDGVTGSGKTEVYLQAIARTIDAGKRAIVLVPEISLTPQTVARFRGRFGDEVAILHSRLGQGERFDQWEMIRRGDAKVVVGARSALFAPVASLGLIVIDEEHEGSYKQDTAPRYVSRDVASWMAKQNGATLILGSATPSIEALYRCEKLENWHHVVLSERVNGRCMPEVTVIDMANEFGSGHRSMFSRELTLALHETIDAGQKAVLLLNQRGFAKMLLCRSCGFVPTCPSCETSLTYHEKGQSLMCHHCGHKESVPPVCPECGSPYLKKFGAGTQRVESELEKVLEKKSVRIIRMDSDTTSKKGAHESLLEQFGGPGAAVLLGTQMIAKGLDFDDVTLVGVINADTVLELPDFRSAERTFDLIEQVAGRAGRAELPGRVMVQTYKADAAAIKAAAHYDRALFLRDELPKRKMLEYPPYVKLVNILIWGANASEVKHVASDLSTQITELVRSQVGESWSIFPATPCVLSKVRNAYRWHIVIKTPPEDDPAHILTPFFRTRKTLKDVNVTIDVDPNDLL